MAENKTRKKIVNEEHVKLLGLFHLISGILTLVYSVFFIFYMGFISIMFNFIGKFENAEYGMNGDFPHEIFTIILSIWGIIIFFMIGFGICKIFSGKYLKEKKNRIFSMIIAALECLSFPYGTLLGVFTLVVLNRESVKELYSS